jgi:hypothetical protein
VALDLERAARAAPDDLYDLRGGGIVRHDPRPPGGVEDRRQAADALGRVPAQLRSKLTSTACPR